MDVASTVFRITARAVFTVIAVSFIASIIFYSLNMIATTLPAEILKDIFALVQIGLPFNISVLTSWLTAVTVVYSGFRLALLGNWLITSIVGRS